MSDTPCPGSRTPCPSRGELVGLLDDQLPPAAANTLTDHVGACVGCRERLEGLACDDPHFSDVVRNVDRDQPPPGSAFWPALDAAEADGTRTAVFALADGTPLNGNGHGGGDGDGHPSGELKLDFLKPAESPDHIGTLGQFQIVRVVGRGGMGVVLQAFDPCLRRDVAVKVLDPQLAGNDTARQRFCREARAAAAVTHENLVAVHQVDEDEASGLPYLVMQLVVGESLEQKIRRSGKLTVSEVARLGMQAAAGLSAAHAHGLIHRDIKPGNILMEADTDRVKLTDFGLARAAEDVKLTRTGFVAGTPLYMAPEQARGDDVDHRADLFSLGTVLYEAASGTPPFDGKTPLAVLRRVADETQPELSKVNADVPPWLSHVVDRLLEKDPADRYQSAAEVAEVFAAELARSHTLSALDVPVEACGKVRSGTRRRGRKVGWKCYVKRALPWAGGVLVGGLAVGLFAEFATPTPAPAPTGHETTGGSPADDPSADHGPPPVAVLDGGKDGSVWSVDFAPNADGNAVVTGTERGVVKLWDVREKSVTGRLPAQGGSVWSTSFAPDGRLLTASDDSRVVVWLKTAVAKSYPQPTAVKSAAFSPDGKKVATGDRASFVRVWDADAQAPVEVEGHKGAVHAVAFGPTGEFFVSAGSDGTAKIWRIGTSDLGEDLVAPVRTLDHELPVYGAAYSPDGSKIATAAADGVVRLWDASNGAVLYYLRGHKGDAWAVSFSPDGTLLASAGNDGTARVWDVATGKERQVLRAGGAVPLHTVRFAREGYRVAAGGRDGNVRVWDLPK